ncbi:MAG: alpha/beta hydrolase [Aureispira sp.]|nr:alpha/beta hydrolase [Aureispira sp.]
MMIMLGCIGAFFLLLIGIFILKNKEVIEASELRAQEKVLSIALSDGQTAYWTYGNSNDPVLVMVHGALIPSVSFDGLAEWFANKGFYVITYEHYGRGFSDRVDFVPTKELYQRQLLELIDTLVPNRPIRLMGYSLGGAISTVFTAQNPNRVKTLTLIAPLVKDPSMAALKLFRLPLFGSWLFRVVLVDKIIKHSTGVFVTNPNHAELAKRIQQQYAVRGTEYMILSSFKEHQSLDFLDYYKQLKQLKKPMQLFAGKVDHLIPFKTIQTARTVMGTHEYYEFDNDHDLIQVKREEILPLINTFLNENV